MPPEISVVIPAYNEGPRLASTIESIASARSTDAEVEVVIVDDGSDDNTAGHIGAALPRLARIPRLKFVFDSTGTRSGVATTRNLAASRATGDVLFITDAHVRFPHGWDALVRQHHRADAILAGAVHEAHTPFVGFGCRLVVPFMGTHWNRERPADGSPVQIAACPATVIARDLYEQLGGYDEGMLIYGAAEPEFSVRAWLSGVEIVVLPELQVAHSFKPRYERVHFVRSVRPLMVANALRFGLLYATEAGSTQLLRYYSLKFPNLFGPALAMVEQSDVWERRAKLERALVHPFSWFVERFNLRDQTGGEIA